jgi:hypothetical protein
VRTTTVTLKSTTGAVRSVLLWIGLKQVHRYVFRNWAVTLTAQDASLRLRRS